MPRTLSWAGVRSWRGERGSGEPLLCVGTGRRGQKPTRLLVWGAEKETGLLCLFPRVPRRAHAAHVGWWGPPRGWTGSVAVCRGARTPWPVPCASCAQAGGHRDFAPSWGQSPSRLRGASPPEAPLPWRGTAGRRSAGSGGMRGGSCGADAVVRRGVGTGLGCAGMVLPSLPPGCGARARFQLTLRSWSAAPWAGRGTPPQGSLRGETSVPSRRSLPRACHRPWCRQRCPRGQSGWP